MKLKKLKKIYDKINNDDKFPVKYQKTLVSNDKIVGIITNTNQLILVDIEDKQKHKIKSSEYVENNNDMFYNEYYIDDYIIKNENRTDEEKKYNKENKVGIEFFYNVSKYISNINK